MKVFSIKYIESKGIQEVEGEIERRGKRKQHEYLVYQRTSWGSSKDLRIGRDCFYTREEALQAADTTLWKWIKYLEGRLKQAQDRLREVSAERSA